MSLTPLCLPVPILAQPAPLTYELFLDHHMSSSPHYCFSFCVFELLNHLVPTSVCCFNLLQLHYDAPPHSCSSLFLLLFIPAPPHPCFSSFLLLLQVLTCICITVFSLWFLHLVVSAAAYSSSRTSCSDRKRFYWTFSRYMCFFDL